MTPSALLLHALLWTSMPAFAGDFGVVLGANHTQVRERTLNDVVHAGGFAGPLGFRLDLGRAEHRHTLALTLNANLLASRYEVERSSVLFGLDLRWRPWWTVPQPLGDLSVAVGPDVSAGSWFMAFSSWDDSHGYYLTSYAIGAAARLRYQLPGRWAVSLELGTPLAAVVARPESPPTRKADDPSKLLGRIHDNARLSSVHRYQGLDLELGAILPGPPGFEPALLYVLTWRHADVTGARPIALLTHTLAVRARFGRPHPERETP